jgi:YbbR domain-containing protein
MNIGSYVLKEKRLKILSLILAIAVWVFVNHGLEKEIIVPARVRVVKIRSGLVLKKVETDTVNLFVRGSPSALREMEEPLVALDLSHYGEGAHAIRIKKENLSLPRGVRVEAVRPSFVRVELAGG